MEAQRCRPTTCTGTLYSSSRKREAENFGWPRGAAFSILCLIRTSMALHLYRQHGVTPSTPRLGRKQGDDCGLLLSMLNNAKLRKRAASATYSQYLCALDAMALHDPASMAIETSEAGPVEDASTSQGVSIFRRRKWACEYLICQRQAQRLGLCQK